MLICGIKASHDGGVAVVENGRLRFSVEVEKLDNRERYSSLGEIELVERVLAEQGLDLDSIDRFVVDGWWTSGTDSPHAIPVRAGHRMIELAVAPYLDSPGGAGPLQRLAFDQHSFTTAGQGYASYPHVSNHLMGAYCTSPFAERNEDAVILVWDGGMVPRLYHVDAQARRATAVSALLPITGNSFADFSSQFDPFYRNLDSLSADELVRHHLSIAGKAMAYAALGRIETNAYAVLDEIIADFSGITAENARVLGAKVASNRDERLPGLSDADIIATFQAYLGELLLRSLTTVVRRRFPGQQLNLALGGGCALNIKWNTLIRSSGRFRDVFVPPFSNDSGAAIGTAACEMYRNGHNAMEWEVYRGPEVTVGTLPAGWRSRPCDERQLAELLHAEGEPVVVLSGRAELGPRALGNRSILAPATDIGMKDRLNAVKRRAAYRPVAPICLSHRAAEVFVPGTVDPYMLFEHRLRPAWAERIPAVVHLDGTARLQTIDVSTDCATARILAAYDRLTGVPVLCNTSANFEGCGFFPDVASAARWGRTRYIWSAGRLYTNPAPVADVDAGRQSHTWGTDG